MSEILRAQLYALRAQLDAILLGLDMATVQAHTREGYASGSCPNCGAPEDKQLDAGNLANPHIKKCLVCNHEYE